MPQRCMCPNFNWEYRMIAALQRRKLNMFKWREGMLSPRVLVWGNPARVKFAAENILICKRCYRRPDTTLQVVSGLADRLQPLEAHALTVTRKYSPYCFPYTIAGVELAHVQHHQYFGVELASDLSWGHHLNKIVLKAQRRFNLAICTATQLVPSSQLTQHWFTLHLIIPADMGPITEQLYQPDGKEPANSCWMKIGNKCIKTTEKVEWGHELHRK